MKREEFIKELGNAILVDRQKVHGAPEQNFQNIANLWTIYLKGNGVGIQRDLTAADVAALQILMKIARIMSTPEHIDNWLDSAGYAACGAECVATQEKFSIVTATMDDLDMAKALQELFAKTKAIPNSKLDSLMQGALLGKLTKEESRELRDFYILNFER